MKGLSEGLVQIIILTATVVMTLIVVSFIFGLLSGVSTLTTAYQVYNAYIYKEGEHYYANFTIRNNLPITIINVEIVGTPLSNSTNITLPPGTHQVKIMFNQQYSFTPGNAYTVEISLSNGKSITVSAGYEQVNSW